MAANAPFNPTFDELIAAESALGKARDVIWDARAKVTCGGYSFYFLDHAYDYLRKQLMDNSWKIHSYFHDEEKPEAIDGRS